ncbi:sensor histidine kinase [Hungatella effluvii]|uniref:sensor histidine kinase n=1 Tax=Hungatella effluvii TaxID=1096246 RepID=UPI002A81BDD5|nr:HAMP domain-containing sensor histidine kinase [Hungatella effluvii]
MDIKLKNRHRISALLSFLIVVAAAVIMTGLYPFFEKEAGRHEQPAYEDQAFLRHLVFGNYVLDLEQYQYANGVVISPFEHFFPEGAYELKNGSLDGYAEQTAAASEGAGNPGDETAPAPEAASQIPKDEALAAGEDTASFLEDEDYGYLTDEEQSYMAEERQEYLRNLRQNCMMEYESWNRYFGSIRNAIDFQVLDENGSILMNYAKDRNILTDDSYVFRVVMQLGGQDTSYLLNILQKFGEVDPMEEYYWEQYSSKPQFKLSNPKNITFAYAMTEQQLAEYSLARSSSWSSYYNSGRVAQVFAGLGIFVALAAFLLSCFDVTRADDSKVLRVPLGIVLGVGAGGIGFGYSLTSLVAVTNHGSLYSGLIRANFLPKAADIMVKLWNVFWWCIPFAIIYWAVLCMRDVFHIGFKRYIRERTLCGLFYGWCAGLCRRFYNFLGSINLQDNSDRTIFKIVGVNFIILAVLCSLWFFGIGALIIYSIVLFLVLRKYYRDLTRKYRILLRATNQIAEGNLDVTISEDLGVFEPFKTEIQKIQSGFKVAVDEEVKSQKMKTDLITNMSHDLKTPLTAIITYVNLLKDDNAVPEQRKAYIDVLEQKSMRLKSLIEDLFEISKANSNNVTLNLVDVDIVSLLKEVSLELSDKIEESTIDFRWNLPDEKIVLPLDSQKTYRIFDNLLTNIMKYGMPNTRAYIDMKRDDGGVVITMKNVSANELTFNPKEITERFVRGDQSRNTEGSGLGMAIAKSFVELQNGKMDVEVEADLFRIIIRWPVEQNPVEEDDEEEM